MASTPTPSPALQPPTGVTPNFTNPESLWNATVVCISICLGFASVLFFLRAYVRIVIKRQWILEDWMCLLSWWFNVTTIEWAPTILCTKLAILLLYRRVFSPHKWSFLDWGIRIFAVILCAFYFATAAVKIWECNPREKIWDKSIPGTCVDLPLLLIISGISNTVTDLIILIIPIKAVWNLQLVQKKKIGIVLVFTIGLTAPLFSIVGLVVRAKISGNPDVTYNQPEISLWAAAEVTSGLMCVCIPALAQLTRERSALGGSRSVANVESHRRSSYFLGTRKPAVNIEETDLFNKAELEMRCQGIIPEQPGGVVTGIQGGADARVSEGKMKELREMGYTVSREDVDRIHGIVTTVRMEHSYV